MGKVYGTNDRLMIEDYTDSDGELAITMAVISGDHEYTDTWINREMAIKIIEQLTSAFDI